MKRSKPQKRVLPPSQVPQSKYAKKLEQRRLENGTETKPAHLATLRDVFPEET